MSLVLSPRLALAVTNALTWLRENPDKHIRGSLAVSADGTTCTPNDPSAECFCVLGRISKELDVKDYPDVDPEWAKVVSPTFSNHHFYDVNDDLSEAEPRELACKYSHPGNQNVIGFVEKKLLKPSWWTRLKAYF